MRALKIAVYPGSFDPVTCGHLDIIKRSCKLFDKVIVAVLNNSSKSPLFSVDERVELINKCIADLPNCEVQSFGGLLVDFVKNSGAHTVIRGLRAISDFEYEFQMALLNKKLAPEDITEETFSRYLYSGDIPDPELIIRPSGEMRISNFLLWQCAYSEFVFMDVLWPDFTADDLDQAIAQYHSRNRRFGGA